MITEMRLENFKGVGPLTSIPFAPITLLYGDNSAGKTALMQAILGLKQTLNAVGSKFSFCVVGDDVDLGSYRELIHAHNLSLPLQLGISVPTARLDFNYSWDQLEQQPVLTQVTAGDTRQQQTVAPTRLYDDPSFRIVKKQLSSLRAFAAERDSWRNWAASPAGGTTIQRLTGQQLHQITRQLHQFGWCYQLRRNSAGAVVLQDTRNQIDIDPGRAGYGLSHVLPVLAELALGSDEIVMIEQPELHLHPGFQAELAEVMIGALGPQLQQVVVETHSEVLMLRLQRRIREGLLDYRQVCVIYVEQNLQGDTLYRRLRLDSQGRFLDEWPQGFFTEQFEETFGDFS